MSASISLFNSPQGTSPKIAILGAQGQLGRQFQSLNLPNLIPLGRSEADLTQPEALAERLGQLAPDLVINCGAYNLVDKAETETAACTAANTIGVMNLAQIGKKINATFVTYSTDHVFCAPPKTDKSGKPIPWTENDLPSPHSIYGASKASGEFLARASWERTYVIRTCGLFGIPGPGGKGGNFVEAILRAVANGRALRVVADQICTPTSVASLVEATITLLRHFPAGLYHLTDQGGCSWQEFASAIVAEAGLGVEVTPISTADWPAAAKRPAYSVLGSIHENDPKFPKLRPWRESLREYLAKRPS